MPRTTPKAASPIAQLFPEDAVRKAVEGALHAVSLFEDLTDSLAERSSIAARVDRYVLAIATGVYGVSDSRPQQGLQDYGENPRATPDLTNLAIVAAAEDLMKKADELIEDLLAEEESEEGSSEVETGEASPPPATVNELHPEHEHP